MFGDWFLRRPDGSTEELSVIDGTLQRVAAMEQGFVEIVNRIDWQEQHFLSFQVAQLHERGLIPGVGQCYGFAPHSILLVALTSAWPVFSRFQFGSLSPYSHSTKQPRHDRQDAERFGSPKPQP